MYFFNSGWIWVDYDIIMFEITCNTYINDIVFIHRLE